MRCTFQQMPCHAPENVFAFAPSPVKAGGKGILRFDQ
jgi:hypothetical protein